VPNNISVNRNGRKEKTMQTNGTGPKNEFEALAQEERSSLLGEFVFFLKENKKWWLLPILLVISVLTLLTIFAGSGAAPLIYTLF
jgi:hypothetical protein